jgi:hypothetical protein
VEAFGDLQEFSRGVEPVEESVHQEDHGRRRRAVPSRDGGAQGRLRDSTAQWSREGTGTQLGFLSELLLKTTTKPAARRRSTLY